MAEVMTAGEWKTHVEREGESGHCSMRGRTVLLAAEEMDRRRRLERNVKKKRTGWGKRIPLTSEWRLERSDTL